VNVRKELHVTLVTEGSTFNVAFKAMETTKAGDEKSDPEYSESSKARAEFAQPATAIEAIVSELNRWRAAVETPTPVGDLFR
jgi:hypothetical protein